MSAKEKIFQDIHVLMTTKFSKSEEAFVFYDKDKDGSLNKDEIKNLLKDAGVSVLLRSLVASEMIKGYDKSGDEKINKEEFKVAIAELNRDY